MSRPVVTVSPSARIREALSLMRAKNIGAVVVTRGEEPVGILTERDVTRLLLSMDRDELLDAEVSRVMSSPLITCGPEKAILAAFITMHEKRIRRLPVVEAGRLVGIVTERDLLYWILRLIGYPAISQWES